MTLKQNTILVVEDDPDTRSIMELYLSKHGYQVVLCENGQQAVDYCRAQGEMIDAILMDIQMPVMDGLDAVRHIRADIKTKNTPIACVSASATSLDKKAGLDAGCNQYLTKPCYGATLLNAIQKALEK